MPDTSLSDGSVPSTPSPTPTPTPMPSAGATGAPPSNATPTSGRKQAFDDVLLPLTPDDLSSPGTQKIILYMLNQSQGENGKLSGFVDRFHEADKRAALLQHECDSERKISKAVDIIVIGGTGLGGVIFGIGPYFLGKTPPDVVSGLLCFVIGAVIIVVAVVARVAKR